MVGWDEAGRHDAPLDRVHIVDEDVDLIWRIAPRGRCRPAQRCRHACTARGRGDRHRHGWCVPGKEGPGARYLVAPPS